MTEFEVVNPTQNNCLQLNRQHQQQPSTSAPPPVSVLLQPNTRQQTNNANLAMVHKIEDHFRQLNEQLGKLTEEEMREHILSNTGDECALKRIQDGLFCAFLVDPANSSKYLNYMNLKTPADWNQIIYDINLILCEAFFLLKPPYRLQIVNFLSEAIKIGVPNLDLVLYNLLRALCDGVEFRETCQLVLSLAQLLTANQQWMAAQKPNCQYPAAALTVFSRHISECTLTAPFGINPELYKGTLITACEAIVRHRFTDLMLLGQDLVLMLMRLAKVPQFMATWKALLHNPSSLLPNLSLQQLMLQSTFHSLLGCRVSVNISRKVENILKQTRLPFNANQASRQSEANKFYEELRISHLNGPDGGSMRGEIIRHLWHPSYYTDCSPAAMEARATFLAWLLRTAKSAADQQWCKLTLFWDWFGFDPKIQNAHFYAEPAFSTTRFLLQTNPALGNSLIDFLIRESQMLYPQLSYFFVQSITNAFKSLEMANIPIQTVLNHPNLDQRLKDQLRSTFPDLFPRKVVSIADNLAEPSSIIDFDAIRSNAGPQTPTTSSAPALGEPQTTNGKEPHSAEAPMKRPKLEPAKMDGKRPDGLKKPKIEPQDGPNVPLKKPKHEQPTSPNKVKKHRESTADETSADGKKERDHQPGVRKRKRLKSKGSHELLGSSSEAHKSNNNCAQAATPSEADPGEGGTEESEEECTSTQLPLADLLAVVREEFREHLEALDKEMRVDECSEVAVDEVQSLLETITDTDDVDADQPELIAICLTRIFQSYLRRKRYWPVEDSSDGSVVTQFGHPIYRLFELLCRSVEHRGETRKALQAIVTKMRGENARVGYLFLFYLTKVERESRSTQGLDVDGVVNAYMEMCRQSAKNEEKWETALVEDLEQCSFDDLPLFDHLLPRVLSRITPEGSPPKLIRFICSVLDPRQLSHLMSEVVRENVVLFQKDTVLAMLTDSLKWDSMEQFMLWQLVQVEPVDFDLFLDLLQRLNYAQHPEATSAILIIMRNMEPELDEQVLRSLLKNLFMRPPHKDMFTVDAIKLLIDYEVNIPGVSNCVSRLVRAATHAGDINAPSGAQQKGGRQRTLSVENIFAHLDRFQEHCFGKEEKAAENLFNNGLMLDMFQTAVQNPKLGELRARLDRFFTLVGILLEDKQQQDKASAGRKHRRGGARAASAQSTKFGADLDSPDGTPKKRKRAAARESSDSSDDDAEL